MVALQHGLATEEEFTVGERMGCESRDAVCPRRVDFCLSHYYPLCCWCSRRFWQSLFFIVVVIPVVVVIVTKPLQGRGRDRGGNRGSDRVVGNVGSVMMLKRARRFVVSRQC